MQNQLSPTLQRFLNKQTLVLVALFVVAFAVYYVTGEGYPNNYDYYVRLADAFLHGRLFLLDNPSWLNELIPFAGGYYVVYPPLPAFIMAPLVAIFGLSLNQTLVSLVFGGFTVALAFLLAGDVAKSQGRVPKLSASVWAAVLFGFGTIFWWIASVGSVWLIAQVVATFFTFLVCLCHFYERAFRLGLWIPLCTGFLPVPFCVGA